MFSSLCALWEYFQTVPTSVESIPKSDDMFSNSGGILFWNFGLFCDSGDIVEYLGIRRDVYTEYKQCSREFSLPRRYQPPLPGKWNQSPKRNARLEFAYAVILTCKQERDSESQTVFASFFVVKFAYAEHIVGLVLREIVFDRRSRSCAEHCEVELVMPHPCVRTILLKQQPQQQQQQ